MPDGELISVTINDGIKKFSELGRHDNSNDDKSKYKKVCVGDIAYNSMRMWQGASGYSPYEGIVSPAYTVLSPNSGINSKCLAYQFKLPEIIHTFQVNSQGITSDNWNLKYPALSQIEIFVSKDEQEQAKIAKYFENLDNLITLHQRNSADFVSRFFSDFTNTWEQRKVREVADRYDNLRIPVAANLRIPGSTPYYGANGIQDYVDGYTHEGEFILVAEDGANDLKNYPVKCVKGRIWVNNHAHVLQGKNEIADNKFLAFAISQADIESLLVGGGRAKLNAETLMEIDLLLPEKQEQVSIGNYFSNLDNLITLHQCEYIFEK
jgi:type I restriction enzyme S subunit